MSGRGSWRGRGCTFIVAFVAAAISPATAAEALVAVATNFAEPMTRLAKNFERRSGHRLRIASGSTGQLYAQILSGAPYDVLLAADEERPARLEADGMAVEGSRFTYAHGRLALWCPACGKDAADVRSVLEEGRFRRIAIANPALAPYGVAATETLGKLGLLERLRPRLVFGENIGQAHAMVATGNTELGFVAASQLVATDQHAGAWWLVPRQCHSPIRQDAVLIARAEDNAAARAFLDYLRSDGARKLIAEAGYDLE